MVLFTFSSHKDQEKNQDIVVQGPGRGQRLECQGPAGLVQLAISHKDKDFASNEV